MVSESVSQSHSESPAQDEAWWAALLAEEERLFNHLSSKKGSNEMDVGVKSEPKDSALPVNPRPLVDWLYAQRLFVEDEMILLSVTGFNRGGILVDGEGLYGFVPISHLVDATCDFSDEERESFLAQYVGRSLYLKVIECDSTRGRVVLSERAAMANSGKRNQLLDELRPGVCVSGIVTNITDFGIFVDLGGIEGLVHVSEISWGRVKHPSDVAKLGQQVTVFVFQVDRERSRIALSLKRLCVNPWETVEDRYQPGQLVEAVITSIAPFGAFARLEEGLDGLIHVTEMGVESDKTIDPRRLLKEGQQVLARVLNIDPARQRLGLSLNLNPTK